MSDNKNTQTFVIQHNIGDYKRIDQVIISDNEVVIKYSESSFGLINPNCLAAKDRIIFLFDKLK